MSLYLDKSGIIMNGPGESVAFMFRREFVPIFVHSVELLHAAESGDPLKIRSVVDRIKFATKQQTATPVPA